MTHHCESYGAMRKFIALIAVLTSGCHATGGMTVMSDVECYRKAMGPPQYLVILAAASVCHRFSDNGTFATIIPPDLTGAPDLQAQASAAGIYYTAH